MAQKRKKTSKKKASLTSTEIQYFKDLLLRKRAEIIGNVNEMQDEALNKNRLDASGDLSSMPIHMADIGSDNYSQEFSLELMDSERKMLREIDDALRRIEQKTYGICEGTAKPIAKARLEAKPWARYCVEHATKVENGLATEEQ